MKKLFLSVLLVLCIGAIAQTENIALNKTVTVTSTAPGFPASNIVDGKISRSSKWEAGSGKAPHIVEIDLKKYYTITELRVHSGIFDAEKKPGEMTQAAGFWSAKNFRMQYWDDANWSDFPKSEVHENRLASVVFTYSPPVTTFRIRLVCDDGEPINIMEIEAFGTLTPNMPAPPTVTSTIPTQGPSMSVQTVKITVQKNEVGRTMKYVGYNQGYYMPGSNVSGWLEYSNVNSVRVWATLNSFVPAAAVQVDSTVNSVQEFDRRKNELRTSPENNKYLKWNLLTPLYDKSDTSSTNAMVFNYALTELKRLHMDVVLQVGSTEFDNNWMNKWKQWQRYYALAFHAARQGDVSMFAMQNEPNHRNSGPMKLDQWIMGMQIVSDAVHAAIQDVNKLYGKNLKAKMVGPVTAGNNPEWWAAVAKNIRTDYHGNTVPDDLMEIFSTHSYNSPAAGYETRINGIRKIIMDNHPAGKPLPIVYTEIGRWMNAYLIDKEETMDSPSLFTEWAGIYTNNMKNGGYGMWAFKFANTASGPYPMGIKSGHHFIWQGKRIVEDAYTNLALHKPTRTSNNANASLITDGKKVTPLLWTPDSTSNDNWVEIDLGKEMTIGSGVIYSGSDGGVYTGPDRLKNFSLRYESASGWKEIPGAILKDNKYAQAFIIFDRSVTTRKVRLVTNDKGILRIREIKLFGADDGPHGEANFNVSGIQRTGEVVRLFAKGFKDERPLLQTNISLTDDNLDAQTSYDSISGNYYIWLVQRGMYKDRITLDLRALQLPEGTPITAESVNAASYGEVTSLITSAASGLVDISLPSQTVMLLTIPSARLTQKILAAAADVTVSPAKATPVAKELQVSLDAATISNNQVSFIRFDLAKVNTTQAKKVILRVHGYNKTDKAIFRFHVYGMNTDAWDQAKINWTNAPLLDRSEALIMQVGQKAAVAGELAFDQEKKYHYLDVTDIVKKYGGANYTFALVRETRQIGDDIDKARIAAISSIESNYKPALIFYTE